ncbi:MAG TPA: hypothetical protein ENO07_00760, partial [candidate division Zixibacteria bacterium]|nr:hypothetical protein [candidate division Zixibacteria bacterium]
IKAGAQGEYNPSRLFNAGAARARGKYLVITNPECFHKSDILGGMDKLLSRADYVVCACLSLADTAVRLKTFDDLKPQVHMWYQHTKHRDVRYHFCTALSRENYRKIGGFDERYAEGIGYDDNSFLDRVTKAGLKILVSDELLVYHQKHEKLTEVIPRNVYMQKLRRNRGLFEKDKRKNA